MRRLRLTLPHTSKTDPRPELKSTRATGAEDLREARAGLTELRRVREVAAVPDEVSGVEQVEDFTVQDEASALAVELERATQAQVLSEEAVVEGKVSG